MGKWKKLRVNAIKESFDQLPTAVCFFDNLGGIVLCNRQMYRLSQYLFQSDMQYLGEVKISLASPPDGVVRLSDMADTYRFPDKTVWQFEWTKVTDRYGEVYTQLTAADITELHRALVQLADDNRKLEEDAKKLRELSENVEAVAREKELLAAKSAMHDSLAACITVTKQYLAGDLGEVDAGMVLQEWGKSIAFREAALLSAKEKLFHDAKSSGVMVRMKGEEPKGSAADLMYVAMQVCLNNAIQYAQATELEINIWNNADNYMVMIGNNGKQPEQTIMEGGGLTNLRHRIEAAGGTMNVQSLPKFSLIIDVPKN